MPQAYNLTERLQLVALPPERYKSLPALTAAGDPTGAPAPGSSSYLHEAPPLPPRAAGGRPWCDGVVARHVARHGRAEGRLGELLQCIGDDAGG